MVGGHCKCDKVHVCTVQVVCLEKFNSFFTVCHLKLVYNFSSDLFALLRALFPHDLVKKKMPGMFYPSEMSKLSEVLFI